jgi:hypothetical protein
MSTAKARYEVEEDRLASEAPGPGHNMPPEPIAAPTPFDLLAKEITDTHGECRLWLDGQEVANEGQAEGLATLLRKVQEAEKKADALRKSEVKPLDDAKAAIQARYHPLIGDTKAGKGMTVLAEQGLKAALSAWLAKKDAEQRALAEAARIESDRLAEEARQAVRNADRTNLAAREAAEAQLQVSRGAEAAAAKLGKTKAQAKGFAGRAVGVRTVWEGTITDEREFLTFVWTNSQHRAELTEFFQGLVSRLVHAGARELPGVKIEDRKVAI